jgi:hypothetical protein
LQHAAHQHFVDQVGVDAGALDGSLDGDGAEVGGGQAGKAALKQPMAVRAAETMTIGSFMLISP